LVQAKIRFPDVTRDDLEVIGCQGAEPLQRFGVPGAEDVLESPRGRFDVRAAHDGNELSISLGEPL
jgi:hypothetical protein